MLGRRVSCGVRTEFFLAVRAAEIVGMSAVFDTCRGGLRIHFHSTDGVFHAVVSSAVLVLMWGLFFVIHVNTSIMFDLQF